MVTTRNDRGRKFPTPRGNPHLRLVLKLDRPVISIDPITVADELGETGSSIMSGRG